MTRDGSGPVRVGVVGPTDFVETVRPHVCGEVVVAWDRMSGVGGLAEVHIDVLVCSAESMGDTDVVPTVAGFPVPIVAVWEDGAPVERSSVGGWAAVTVSADRIATGLAAAIPVALSRSHRVARREFARYRDIVEMVREGIYESDEDGVLTFANPALARMLGASRPEALVGRPFADFLQPSEVERQTASYRQSIETGRGSDVHTVEAVGADGRPMRLEIRPTPIVVDGRAVGSRGIVRDVSKESEAMRELHLLSRAIETSPTVLLIADAHGVIKFVNRRWTELSGLTSDQVVGRGPGDLRASLGEQPIFEGLWEAVLHKRTWRGRLTHPTGAGDRVVDTVVTPVADGDGRTEHFVSVGIDVTEIAELNERLATVDKWQAIGQLAGGIAHDLNNHLGVVLASTQLALTRLSPDDTATREDLEGVASAAAESKRLVQAVLASSRRSRIAMQPGSIGDAIEGALDGLRENLGPGVELSLDVRPGAPVVAVDPAAFEQVLSRLVENARDAMPDGGTVLIEVGPRFVDEAFHESHPWCPKGSYAEVVVRDPGTGMDGETHGRAFEMFFTTKRGERSSGLGLPVAFGLMKQHGGFMLLDSVLGEGTTVRLLFPALQALAEQTDVPTDAREVGAGGRVVLYVEDNDRLRRAGRRALEGDGFRVIEAVDGEDGLAKYAEHGPEIDVVISDLMMPRLGGAELYRRLVAEHGPVPFIITSGHVDEDPEHRDYLPSDVPYLLKPWGVDELTAAVARVLSG